jgi:hypothetical protein
MSKVWLAALLLVWLVKNQLAAKPLRSSLFTFPLLLLAVAAYSAYTAGVRTGEGISLGIAVVLGIGAGLVQGKFTAVYEENGVWMRAGSFAALLVWLLSVPIRFCVRYGFVELFHIEQHLTGSSAFVPYLFSLGGILLGKVIMLALRYPEPMMAAARGERRLSRRAVRRLR